MTRRTFLKATLATGLLPSVLPRCLSAQASASSKLITLDDLPLLFVDDSGLAKSHGVTRTFHPARTRAEPVLVADRPWERGRVYIYGTVTHDAATGEFRMWYSTPKPSFLTYATSPDGLTWTKPSLDEFPYEGSIQTNIAYSGLHSTSLLIDPAAPTPEERYRMIGVGEHGYEACHSADGLHWQPYPYNPILQGDDTLTLARDPATGRFLLYHKQQVMVRGWKRRTVWLSQSEDFRTWSKVKPAFQADEEDDAWAKKGQRTDVYNMSVFPNAAGFVGLPTIFHVQQVRPKEVLGKNQAGDDGPINVQLAHSTDGAHWLRPTQRINLIPLGAHGEFDRGAILGVSNTFVHHGDESWLYYTALNTTHGAPVPPKQLTIGRAEWRRHGLASLDAGAATAHLEIRPFTTPCSSLLVNADASRGLLRAALLDKSGHALPGYGLEDCLPLRENLTQSPLRWKSSDKIPQGTPLRLAIEMTNTQLFSLSAA